METKSLHFSNQLIYTEKYNGICGTWQTFSNVHLEKIFLNSNAHKIQWVNLSNKIKSNETAFTIRKEDDKPIIVFFSTEDTYKSKKEKKIKLNLKKKKNSQPVMSL